MAELDIPSGKPVEKKSRGFSHPLVERVFEGMGGKDSVLAILTALEIEMGLAELAPEVERAFNEATTDVELDSEDYSIE